jgi:hypothetical protein
LDIIAPDCIVKVLKITVPDKFSDPPLGGTDAVTPVVPEASHLL